MKMFSDKFYFFNSQKINKKFNYFKLINFKNLNFLKINWLPNHFLINLDKNSLKNITLYYIRTQKRYNKMRYARTRRYSRVAFYVSLLALLLVGQRLEWMFNVTTTYTFKIRWLFNFILILSPLYSCIKINLFGVTSLIRFFFFYYRWIYLVSFNFKFINSIFNNLQYKFIY